MKSMMDLGIRLPFFYLYRQLGWPYILPANYTFSLSSQCNSRCLTCRVWERENHPLTLDEWERTLISIGSSAYWITISGGEPFLSRQIVEFCELAFHTCHPAIINIPTNGILDNIPEKVGQITKACRDTAIIINLSLDGIGEKHDQIRGVPGNFERFERTLKNLLELREQTSNLQVGIHTVVSTFNIKEVDNIIAYANQTGADQFITEMAEERNELGTIGLAISPDQNLYMALLDRLIIDLENRSYKKVARMTRAFRIEYYRLVKQVLKNNRQVIPCYAGWLSAQIFADGTVWPCCVRADPLGNLRDYQYDFRRIWFGEKSKPIRKSIKSKECFCPLANASYTNMLMHIPTLYKISRSLIRSIL